MDEESEFKSNCTGNSVTLESRVALGPGLSKS